ncbi:MAG: CpsD/CapB family tyrosine-protein kinase, partial [Thiothrix sp.]|nr:CpsD/CapB family tyrosine-protein kinase [Thiothrix sp.]
PVLGVIPGNGLFFRAGSALTPLSQPHSRLTEAYRIGFTNLKAHLTRDRGNAIVLTSRIPGEGKSTSAIQFAHICAAMRYSVLLLDADMRRPSLHRRLGLENHVGLSDYLNNSSNVPNIHAIGPDNNLHVLTAGSGMPDPVALLSSKHMQALMEIAAKRYHYIIIDAPPLKGFADPLVLAAMADATVLVVSPPSSHRRELTAAVQRIERAGGHLAGVLRTRVRKSEAMAGQAYYDSYRRRDAGRSFA